MRLSFNIKNNMTIIAIESKAKSFLILIVKILNNLINVKIQTNPDY